MGKGNATHHDGQVLTECPGCGQTIRLAPSKILPYTAHPHCGSCGTSFLADRRTGEVL